MHYTWESVGDQDETIRKICYLGPYLLEHVESRWVKKTGKDDEILMMASNVYFWNDEDKIPDLIHELPEMEYKRDESVKVLEDWYALNVLSEELFLGVSGGPDSRGDSES